MPLDLSNVVLGIGISRSFVQRNKSKQNYYYNYKAYGEKSQEYIMSQIVILFIFYKGLDFLFSVWYNIYVILICSGIEVVITDMTRNHDAP